MLIDLSGPISPLELCGERHAQLFTVDFSGTMLITSMSFKSGVAKSTKNIVLHA